MANPVARNVSPKIRPSLVGVSFSWHEASTCSALLCFAFVVAVVGLLRFTALGKQSLWYDEIFSAHMATTPLGNMWRETQKEPHPPLYYLLLRLWMAGFRFDDLASRDFALRALSAFWGTVAVAAIGWTAWRLHSPAAGVLAASFASALPPLVHYGQEARMYSLLVVLLTLALAGALFWHHDRSRRSAWLYALALAAALYTHYHSVFVWVGMAFSYGAYLAWQRLILPGFCRQEVKRSSRSLVLSLVCAVARTLRG